MLTDGYVTEESGTGVVHSAPAFGEVSFVGTSKQCAVHFWLFRKFQLAS